MEKLSKTQVATIILILILLLFIPFIPSSSLRTSYLYFLLNILIFALALEAGLLNSISNKPIDEKKPTIIKTHVPNIAPQIDHSVKAMTMSSYEEKKNIVQPIAHEKPSDTDRVQKVNIRITTTSRVQKLKRIASKPSLFFICSSESDGSELVQEEEEVEEKNNMLRDETEELSKQELFAKADSFISNFYKQLRMQREESWKKLQEFQQKAF